MKVNVLYSAVDLQSTVAARAALPHLTVLVHVHKAGSSQTHHRYVTVELPLRFIQPFCNQGFQPH